MNWGEAEPRLAEVMRRAVEATPPETWPGPWLTHPDTGRRFRVLGVVWRDEQGLVAEIEWEAR